MYHKQLRELDVTYNEIDDLPSDDGAFPALEKLAIGCGWADDHVQFIANLDLAQFPKLRMLEQEFSNLPKLAFDPKARLWNAPALECFSFGAVFDEIVPPVLLRRAASAVSPGRVAGTPSPRRWPSCHICRSWKCCV